MKKGLVVTAVATLAAGIVYAPPALAAPGDGSAYAVQTSVTLLGGSPINVGPLAASNTAGPTTAALASATIPGVLVTGTLTSSSTNSNGNVTSTATVNNPSLPLLAALGAVSGSSASATCSATQAGETGTVTLTNFTLGALGALAANPAPNTVIQINVAGIHVATLTLNEQIANADGSLTVNAWHLHLIGGGVGSLGTGDVILASGTCGPAASPNPVATSTTVTAAPNPALQGASVTLTATVTAQSGTTDPTGTVDFSTGGNSLTNCASVALSNGVATCTTTSLPLGSDSVTASYTSSDATSFSNSMGSGSVTIQAPLTMTTTPSSTIAGAPVSDSVTITGGGPFTTGTVSFALYAPSDTSCTAAIATSTVNVTSGGVVDSGTVASPTQAGAYHWIVTFDGRPDYALQSTSCGEPTVVGPAALESMTLSPANATITAGDSETYSATGTDQYGNSLGVLNGVTYTIDGNPCSGATCTAGVGSHVVDGTTDGVTGTTDLTVQPGPVAQLAIDPTQANTTAGVGVTFTTETEDALGNPISDATGATTFTISGSGTCVVNVCTATKAGTYTVTGTDGALTASAQVQVTAAAAVGIQVSPSATVVAAGIPVDYTATLVDQYGNSISDVTQIATWSIDNGGSCTANACGADDIGTYTVTATSGAFTGTATLTIEAGAATSLAVSPATDTVQAGTAVTYTAVSVDRFGNPITDVTAATSFTASTDGACAASVCTPTTAGTQTITATDGSLSGTASLTVTPAVAVSLTVTPASSTVAAGTVVTYTAESVDQYGNNVADVTAATTFDLSPDGSCVANACSATVSGAHTVTATDGKISGTGALTITAGAAAQLMLAPASTTVTAGTPVTYTVTASDQYGNPVVSPGAVSLAVSPDGSCSGLTCSATVAGPHTVTATSGALSTTASLAVTAGTGVALTIAPTARTVVAGAAVTYTVRTVDQYGNAVSTVTAASRFSIEPDGSCTANSCVATVAGAHTVTATADGLSATARQTVTPGPASKLVLSPASATASEGVGVAFSATAQDQYGNVIGDVTASATFTISAGGTCNANVCSGSRAGTYTVTGAYTPPAHDLTLAAVTSDASGFSEHAAVDPSEIEAEATLQVTSSSASGTGGVAATGQDVLADLLTGFAAIAAGLALLMLSRRRRRAA